MAKYDRYQWAVPPAPIPEEEISETITTDAVVVGAGFSGCALRAAAMRSATGIRSSPSSTVRRSIPTGAPTV